MYLKTSRGKSTMINKEASHPVECEVLVGSCPTSALLNSVDTEFEGAGRVLCAGIGATLNTERHL